MAALTRTALEAFEALARAARVMVADDAVVVVAYPAAAFDACMAAMDHDADIEIDADFEGVNEDGDELGRPAAA